MWFDNTLSCCAQMLAPLLTLVCWREINWDSKPCFVLACESRLVLTGFITKSECIPTYRETVVPPAAVNSCWHSQNMTSTSLPFLNSLHAHLPNLSKE